MRQLQRLREYAAAHGYLVVAEVTATARRKPLGFRPSGEAGLRWREPAVLVCYRFRAAQLEYAHMSEQTMCRKTCKEKLSPTPAQARALERVLWR